MIEYFFETEEGTYSTVTNFKPENEVWLKHWLKWCKCKPNIGKLLSVHDDMGNSLCRLTIQSQQRRKIDALSALWQKIGDKIREKSNSRQAKR